MVISIRENLHKEGTFNSRIIIPYKKKKRERNCPSPLVLYMLWDVRIAPQL